MKFPHHPSLTHIFAQEVGELNSDKTIAMLTPKIDEKTSQNMLYSLVHVHELNFFFVSLALPQVLTKKQVRHRF